MMETVSISLGPSVDGRPTTSIVLPRGHELVKHLEALLPSTLTMTTDKQTHDAIAMLAKVAQETSTPALPGLPRHLFSQNSPTSSSHPSSPYHSDSSASTSSTSNETVSARQTSGARRRRGMAAPTSGKKCQIPDCDKISVSRGLCRGHGGGRRCQHEGCSKGAQSRSDFCWAHGGGQRCEVKNCMRSRKSKRFCVAHLNWESYEAGHIVQEEKTVVPRVIAPAGSEPVAPCASKLPSLAQALQKHQCSRVPVPSAPLPFVPLTHILNGASA